MLETTRKNSRTVIIEKVDFRSTHKAKKDLFRISVGDELPLEVSPAELKKLGKIARSYFKKPKKAKS